MTKRLIGVGLAVVGLVGSVAGEIIPVSGSFFTPTNVGGTNAIRIAAATSTGTVTTNPPAAVAVAVPINGVSGSIAVMGQYVNEGPAGGGNTNNGGVYIHLVGSLDGVTYTTISNYVTVFIPGKGGTPQVSLTNLANSLFGGAAYLKIGQIACTNIGGGWVTNLTFRFERTE